jgi:hypothetical protein
MVLLACAVAAQAAVERAIFTARELERRTKLNSYVLGVSSCFICEYIWCTMTRATPRPGNMRPSLASSASRDDVRLQSDHSLSAPLIELLKMTYAAEVLAMGYVLKCRCMHAWSSSSSVQLAGCIASLLLTLPPACMCLLCSTAILL